MMFTVAHLLIARFRLPFACESLVYSSSAPGNLHRAMQGDPLLGDGQPGRIATHQEESMQQQMEARDKAIFEEKMKSKGQVER